jgi:hypothetical protein
MHAFHLLPLILCLFEVKAVSVPRRWLRMGLVCLLPQCVPSRVISLLSLPSPCLFIWQIGASGQTWLVEAREFEPGVQNSGFWDNTLNHMCDCHWNPPGPLQQGESYVPVHHSSLASFLSTVTGLPMAIALPSTFFSMCGRELQVAEGLLRLPHLPAPPHAYSASGILSKPGHQ